MKKVISGKVRDVYDISEQNLIIVTSDRISAFDVILSKPVKDKGKILNSISKFWFDYTNDIVQNHMITDNVFAMPKFFQKQEFKDRTIMVKKLNMLPFEFVIRGYIFGNMWSAYKEKREFCGIRLDGEYVLAQKLKRPILTPSTKVDEGHDRYVSFQIVKDEIGNDIAEKIWDICFKLYKKCYTYAYSKGIIIADAKFEFGIDESNNLILADEIFTPDSSRFWSVDRYELGRSPKSYDKQFIRDWLLANKIHGEIQYDNVPDEIIAETEKIYRECEKKLLH